MFVAFLQQKHFNGSRKLCCQILFQFYLMFWINSFVYHFKQNFKEHIDIFLFLWWVLCCFENLAQQNMFFKQQTESWLDDINQKGFPIYGFPPYPLYYWTCKRIYKWIQSRWKIRFELGEITQKLLRGVKFCQIRTRYFLSLKKGRFSCECVNL